MTLCIAWKRGRNTYLASDSRLTNGMSLVTNEANKIFKVKVEIYGPIPADIDNAVEPIIYQSSFGLCFAGSYINGSVLADTIEEVLTNIQATPYSDISIENLSDIAFVIYKKVSEQLMQLHQSGGLSEVLFGGYCPLTGELKFFKFMPRFEPHQLLEFEKIEVEITEQATFIGDTSAKTKANSLLTQLSGTYSYFHLLRDVINDVNIPSVGGNIQAGLFKPNNFKTYGIVEYSKFKDEYGFLNVKDSYKFRGLSLDLDDNELRKGDVHINKPFLNPFEDERNQYFAESMDSIETNLDTFLNRDESVQEDEN